MSVDKIEKIIEGFNTQTLAVEDWTHQAHLLVALWHLQQYSFHEALCLMRAKIICYNQTVGTPNSASRGYHETLTQFYLREIDKLLNTIGKQLPFEQLADALLKSEIATTNYPMKFYSKEQLFSVEARACYLIATG
jgi:hypothetical protein